MTERQFHFLLVALLLGCLSSDFRRLIAAAVAGLSTEGGSDWRLDRFVTGARHLAAEHPAGVNIPFEFEAERTPGLSRSLSVRPGARGWPVRFGGLPSFGTGVRGIRPAPRFGAFIGGFK